MNVDPQTTHHHGPAKAVSLFLPKLLGPLESPVLFSGRSQAPSHLGMCSTSPPLTYLCNFYAPPYHTSGRIPICRHKLLMQLSFARAHTRQHVFQHPTLRTFPVAFVSTLTFTGRMFVCILYPTLSRVLQILAS